MKDSNELQIINCNEISSDEIKQQNIASLETSITNKGIKIYRKLVYNQEIKLESMTTKLAHKLFVDFKNDEMLFEDKKDIKEFIYDETKVNNYIQNKEKDGYILLAILYKEDVIGEIRFKGIEDSCSEIGIVLKNDRYKNKGMGTIAISKALDYAKDILKLNKVIASILKTNKRSQYIFEKIGFIFYDGDDHFDKYYKKL
jgi:RimJ/RimL family protein N-acetyltransferase